jgi:uncharacterized protein
VAKFISMRSILFIILLLIPTILFSQQLVRKGWFGARLDPISADDVKTLQLKNSDGLKIVQIVGGTAKALDLQVNDVLLSLNSQKFAFAKAIVKYMNSQKENGEVIASIIRNGKPLMLTNKIVGKPRETDKNCDIIYESIAYKGGKLSVIINKPRKTGKLPAMLFIPGYTCNSIDALKESDPYGKIIRAYSNAGYVVMRVEKSGLGDCENTPDCSATDLYAEVANFEAGLRKLKTLNYVDTNNIFLFGHSMGGIVAPAISATNNVHGVIVFGTVINSFFEFQQGMNRLQFQLAHPEPIEYERKCRVLAEIMHEFYIEKKDLANIAKNKEKLEELKADWQYDGTNIIWGRNMEYWRQIQDFDLVTKWKNTTAKVLALHGGADIQSYSKAEPEQIVYTVNYYHPNNASLITFPETDHLFAKVGTQQKSSDLLLEAKYQELYEAYDVEVAKQSIAWSNAQIVK